MRPTLTGLEDALADPPARLRELLARELAHGEQELTRRRSGYEHPVVVAFAPVGGGLAAATPAPVALRADPDVVDERTWLIVAAAVGALVAATDGGELDAGEHGGRLALVAATRTPDAELAAVAFEEQVDGVDRLRARALALPGGVLDPADRKEPIGPGHPLKVAARVARLGGRPADPASLAEHEEAILAALPAVTRPHEDPDPRRRAARRILQRLNGMGKWGGYHTEFVHLSKGFTGNDKHLAEEIGERLVVAGLLSEKQSVGQRHVFLNPRRAGDIHRLIDDGTVPTDLRL